jgi:hypothetical protein
MLDEPRTEPAADDAARKRIELPVVLAGDIADNHVMMLAARTPS